MLSQVHINRQHQ